MDGSRNFESYCPIFDGETRLVVNHYSRNLDLLRGLVEHPSVAKLRWFTGVCYAVSRVRVDIVITDLRIGSKPNYVFSFAVARAADPHPVPVRDVQRDAKIVHNRPHSAIV
jgi:inner membrane protein